MSGVVNSQQQQFTAGSAYDVILIKGGLESVSCSEPLFWFGPFYRSAQGLEELGYTITLLLVDETTGTRLRFSIRNNKIQEFINDDDENNEDDHDDDDNEDDSPKDVRTRNQVPDHADHNLASLQRLATSIQPGKNPAWFLLSNADHHLVSIAETNIFLWFHHEKLCVIDIDGTITTSTFRGFVNTAWLGNYSCCHQGVCQFLSTLAQTPDLRLLYLTSRPLKGAYSTRKFLAELRQDSVHQLPEAALIGFTGTYAGVLGMEFAQSVHTFKFESLISHVLTPLSELDAQDMLWAGFGNSSMDMEAYHMAGMPLHRMYIIDKKSRLYCLDKPVEDEEALYQSRDYGKAKGTFFANGYHDDKLLPHIRNYNQNET